MNRELNERTNKRMDKAEKRIQLRSALVLTFALGVFLMDLLTGVTTSFAADLSIIDFREIGGVFIIIGLFVVVVVSSSSA